MNIKCDYSCEKSYKDETKNLLGSQCWGVFEKYAPKWCRNHVMCALMTMAERHHIDFDLWAIRRLDRQNNPLVREVCLLATQQKPVREKLEKLDAQLGPMEKMILIVLLDRLRYGRVDRARHMRTFGIAEEPD